MAEEEKQESEKAVGSAGGGSKLVMILTIVNLLATLGIGGVVFLSFTKNAGKARVEDIVLDEGHGAEGEHGGEGERGGEGEHGAPAAKKSNIEFGKIVDLNQFIVNLATPGSNRSRFVRVNVSVELPNEDSQEEFGQKMPQVRNTIIDLFNSKRPTDLMTPEGRDFIKEEIKNAINSFMVTGKVKGVYFTSFSLSS